jgi:hypothetical protein
MFKRRALERIFGLKKVGINERNNRRLEETA